MLTLKIDRKDSSMTSDVPKNGPSLSARSTKVTESDSSCEWSDMLSMSLKIECKQIMLMPSKDRTFVSVRILAGNHLITRQEEFISFRNGKKHCLVMFIEQ